MIMLVMVTLQLMLVAEKNASNDYMILNDDIILMIKTYGYDLL